MLCPLWVFFNEVIVTCVCAMVPNRFVRQNAKVSISGESQFTARGNANEVKSGPALVN